MDGLVNPLREVIIYSLDRFVDGERQRSNGRVIACDVFNQVLKPSKSGIMLYAGTYSLRPYTDVHITKTGAFNINERVCMLGLNGNSPENTFIVAGITTLSVAEYARSLGEGSLSIVDLLSEAERSAD